MLFIPLVKMLRFISGVVWLEEFLKSLGMKVPLASYHIVAYITVYGYASYYKWIKYI